MTLHSTSKGGRRRSGTGGREIVGEVILKGRRKFWNKAHCHYHHGMQAGENTLNAQCVRILMRALAENGGQYRKESFLNAYIDYMTAEPPAYSDVYAESYHRGFFANLENGRSAHQCGATTHDTASVGGLVSIAALVFAERLAGTELSVVQERCRSHLMLTHPDETLAGICAKYVTLLHDLLVCESLSQAREVLQHCARESVGSTLLQLVENSRNDFEVIGGNYSPACYISGAWPGVLYLALKYLGNSKDALIANTNLGGDNVHRGFVLGTILGLIDNSAADTFYNGLLIRDALDKEISDLVSLA